MVSQMPSWLNLLINPGNDGIDYDWALANLNCTYFKNGQLSHSYGFYGELNNIVKQSSLPTCVKSRGEFQAIFNSDSWQNAPAANTFTLIVSALSMFLDMFDIGNGPISVQNSLDTRPYELMNRFGGLRNPLISNRAFIYLRDVPDLADMARFPEPAFPPLVSPGNMTLYTNRLAQINNSPYGDTYKADQRTNLKETFMNLARVNKIVSNFTAYGAMFDSLDAGNIYGGNDFELFFHDFGIDMLPDNYGLFMKQINATETSIGRYRVGCNKTIVPEPIYGRYARSFHSSTGKTQMTFDLDDSLMNSAKVKNNLVEKIDFFF